MGYKSTRHLTRKQCRQKIKERLKQMSDTELEDLCEQLLGEKECANYSIVSEERLAEIHEAENRAFKPDAAAES